MTTTQQSAALIPDDVARAAVLPESYTDEKNVTYPAFAWLRKNNPLGVAQLDGFDPIHLVTKFDDLISIERRPEIFANAPKNPILNSQADDAFIRSLTGGSIRSIDVVTYMDPPEHTTIRRLINPWFRPGNVKQFAEQVRGLAKREVDRLFDYDGECDFAKDFGLLYPLRVIMTLFGLPPEDEPKVMKLTQEFFGTNDPEEQRAEVAMTPDAAARMWTAAVADFNAYFHQHTMDRRANPTDDLLSIIANSKIDGEFIDERYANGEYIAIATAGHDTTSATLVGAMLALIENPDQLRLVQNDMSLVDRLVEESIRYVSPVKHFMRTAVQDAEVRGQTVHEGDRFMLCFPSANRDEEKFGPDSHDFDVTVDRGKHAGFGFGPHQCQGMMIARLELKILFEELLPRLGSVELNGTPRYTQTNFVGGLKSLPIRFRHA
ncbi:cytochrome P450 [Pseudonocardia spinosispora]|uniref:cytochrome P450 n=1 Tax=Pseudonocardia spinosispora TaxID=103441 RepID=UPI00048A829D|nr:cytochrome P450 [Pseudonocardia spinosispora]